MRKTYFAVFLSLMAVAMFALAVNLSQGEEPQGSERKGYQHEEEPAVGQHDIVAMVGMDRACSRLAEALREAGLTEALQAKGPFTLFAPTNSAFEKLPGEEWARLTADKEGLAALLKFHIVPGRITAADLAEKESARTWQG